MKENLNSFESIEVERIDAEADFTEQIAEAEQIDLQALYTIIGGGGPTSDW